MKKLLVMILTFIACGVIFAGCTNQDTTESDVPKLVEIKDGKIQGQDVYLAVSKDIDNIFLFDLIKVTDDAVWKVIDINNDVITSKVVQVIDGINVFYLEVSLPDGTKSTMYTLLINKAKAITVTYLYPTGYGLGEEVLKEVEIEPGTLFKADYIPNITGFDFFYWHTRGSDMEFKEGILNYDTHLVAKVSKKTAKLHLIVDGEEWQSINTEYGSWVELPIPEKKHYHFGNSFYNEWYYDDTFSSPFGTNYRCYTSGDVYIYGRFVPTSYTITYDFGEIAHNRKEYEYATYGKDFELYELNYSYTTYNGVKYYFVGYTYNGNPFESGKYLYNGDITVEAVWMPESEYKQNN